jgi:hypothetical protein
VAVERCHELVPRAEQLTPGHWSACLRAEELAAKDAQPADTSGA